MNPDEIRAVYDLLPDDWEIARTSDLVRRSEEVERQRQHMRETIERWRNRALKAEAAVTRVENLCKSTDGEWLDSGFDGNTVGDIRAALGDV